MVLVISKNTNLMHVQYMLRDQNQEVKQKTRLRNNQEACNMEQLNTVG